MFVFRRGVNRSLSWVNSSQIVCQILKSRLDTNPSRISTSSDPEYRDRRPTKTNIWEED